MAYLGRYTHRVAIANSRLVALGGSEVSFRWRDYRHQNKNKVMTLTAEEFIRRFLLHALPDGFHRIRHYGFLANRGRAGNLALCRKLLDEPLWSQSMIAQKLDTPSTAALAVAVGWSRLVSSRERRWKARQPVTTAREHSSGPALIASCSLRRREIADLLMICSSAAQSHPRPAARRDFQRSAQRGAGLFVTHSPLQGVSPMPLQKRSTLQRRALH